MATSYAVEPGSGASGTQGDAFVRKEWSTFVKSASSLPHCPAGTPKIQYASAPFSMNPDAAENAGDEFAAL